MNNIKLAFKLLQDSGNFEPSQLHEGNDCLWITPHGNVIDYKQLQLAMAAAELFYLLNKIIQNEPAIINPTVEIATD